MRNDVSLPDVSGKMNESTAICRRILVLARNEPEEAMRVAAGLTIIGHELELVFMHRPLTEDEAESEHAELLELCEIVPKTTVEGMREHFTLLDSQALAALISESERVISL